MSDTWIIVIGLISVVVLVFINALFVAAEFSFVGVRRTRVEQLASTGKGRARLLLSSLQHLDRSIATTQLGITMAGLALGWLGEPILAKVIEPPVFAVLALLLLASHLAGYPVFGATRRQPEPSHSLGVGDAVDVVISGRLARDHATLRLDRSPGAVERLPISDLALRMWRYGLLSPELSRQEAERRFVQEAGASGNRPVVHERDQSALVVLGRGSGASVQAGRLHRLGRSVPAVHVRHDRTDAHLELRSTAERDRVAAEILAEVGEAGD